LRTSRTARGLCSGRRPVPEGGLDDLRFQARTAGRDAGRAAVDQERRAERRIGETIPLGRDRTLRVVGIVVSNEDEPSVLIVEDVA
jgi:hypothetical protein